jgi:hypothetical protein
MSQPTRAVEELPHRAGRGQTVGTDRIPIECVDGVLVWQVRDPRFLGFDLVAGAAETPVVTAAYFGGVRLRRLVANQEPPYDFPLPTHCNPERRPRSVQPQAPPFFNGPTMPAYLVLSPGCFTCILYRRAVGRGLTDSAQFVSPILQADAARHVFTALEGHQHIWQYCSNGRNDLLVEYTARRANIAGPNHPQFIKFCVEYGCYAYASGLYETARTAFGWLRPRLEQNRSEWLPLPKQADGSCDHSQDPHYATKCFWWIVTMKSWLLETDVHLLRGDREGVKAELKRFLALVDEIEPFLKDYHILWGLQEVYTALILFRLIRDPEVDSLVHRMEQEWGPKLMMLFGTPWGHRGTFVNRPDARDFRAAANRLMSGRGTADDLSLLKHLLGRDISRQNRLTNQLSWAFLMRTKGFPFIGTFRDVAQEAKPLMFARPMVLMYTLIQEVYGRGLPLAPTDLPPAASNGSFVEDLASLVSEFIEWFFSRNDYVLREAVQASYLRQNALNTFASLLLR